ncbi:SMP-30/gluconolactonase/LRE family protein [Paracoccus sp. S1E-3]|uniref:SMP-30/gluconolactonase/LRE family protein n=1 Tax=Paracoccus sp. S1E-3 TaxID=2756130 RepID=UPI0015EEBB93|nr:SMP-30/gluconolactonase/LRE family protein [Paracoccus sp. S1E-3]MBA4491691.1 SMP-30/gluconolactonase/LRE family protein [Paracoccus sp. S1E-3]
MVILDDHRLELGEGPGYDPATGLAWWFDIVGRRLFTRAGADDGLGTETQVFDLPIAASALAFVEDGSRQLLLAEDGLYLRDPVSGALESHLPLEADNPATRSNDARVHPSGAFWVSTMGWQTEPGAGSIYHYRAGRLQRLFEGVTIPNAICFSPDGRIAYYADTARNTVFRVATDPATGLPGGAPEVFLTDFDGGPDGAVTDAAGNIWIAIWGAGRVAGFAPDGRVIGSIAVGAAHASCPAFIGADARRMLVTSARLGLDEAQLRAAPDAGATFCIDIDFAGKFDPRVML